MNNLYPFNPLKPPKGWTAAIREYNRYNTAVTVGLVSAAGVLATFYRTGLESWYCPQIQFCDGSVLSLED